MTSDNDLIRRGDVLRIIKGYSLPFSSGRYLISEIAEIPAVKPAQSELGKLDDQTLQQKVEGEWEYYIDEAYFHNWAVKKKSEKRFCYTLHLVNEDEAKALCDLLNKQQELLKKSKDILSKAIKLWDTRYSFLSMGHINMVGDEVRSTLSELEKAGV